MPDSDITARYDYWPANFVVVFATAIAVVVVVLVHYEGLTFLNGHLRTAPRRRRRMVLYAICSLLGLHILEIWIFGLAYHLLLKWPAVGQIGGQGLWQITAPAINGIFDHVYFSATVFTTVGFGDLSPSGPIRFMAGTEGITGLVLAGWSASFTYLEMERYWRPRP
jgi:hypothetical protein